MTIDETLVKACADIAEQHLLSSVIIMATESHDDGVSHHIQYNGSGMECVGLCEQFKHNFVNGEYREEADNDT